jgi:hypothetical protein
MKKFGWIICVLIFIIITTFVIFADNTAPVQRVKVTNKDLAINNKMSNFDNENIKIEQKSSNIDNTEVTINNNSPKIEKKEYTLSQNSIFRTSDVEYNNEQISNSNYRTSNSQKDDYNTLKSALDKPRQKTSLNKEDVKYGYKYIDWRTWKSNFVNKIVDDSLEIKSLDDYPMGTVIYYSFTVYKDGRIGDVIVTSPFVLKEDKDKLAELIKSYEYTPIAEFPRGAQRKTAWVHAIMFLSDSQTYSNPRDFDIDMERVKTRL